MEEDNLLFKSEFDPKSNLASKNELRLWRKLVYICELNGGRQPMPDERVVSPG